MPTSLLATKTYIPSFRPDLVVRPRLIQRLEAGPNQGHGLTLISAPAGFGKTSLVTAWLQQDKHPCAWLSLDDGDNDPSRFWRYVIAALRTVDPDLGETALTMLQAPQPPPLESIVTALINDLVNTSSPLILVLDDYHIITTERIHTSLDFLLDHQPPHLHILIATREDPPLSLPRRRARQQSTEIRVADLRFTTQEASELLNAVMGLGLPTDDILALGQRTEGWVVGLQMAALSLQGRADKHDFVTAFAGDDRYIADYLIEEVLQRQPPHVQSFLLQTSILSRLTGALCDAVIGRSDSRAILNDLERANLFIVPLDSRREWYRYHRLFADLLHQRLLEAMPAADMAQLHRRASQWCEQHQLMAEAVQHALATHDYAQTIRLIEQTAPEMFMRSELNTLLEWIRALPGDVLASQPRLCMMCGWAARATSHPQEAEHCMQLIEQAVGAPMDALSKAEALTPEARAALVEVTVLRMSAAIDRFDFPRVLELAERVLPFLSDAAAPFLYNTPLDLRPVVSFSLGAAHEILGEMTAASHAFDEAAQGAQAGGNNHIIALAVSHLAQVQSVQGHLHTAERTYQEVLRQDREKPAYSTPFSAVAKVGLGLLAYEWNDLEAAQAQFEAGIAQAKIWNSWESLLPGLIGLAQIKQARGDSAGAFQSLDELAQLTADYPALAQPLLEATRARLWITQGHLEAADRWAQTLGLDLAEDIPYFRQNEAIILARLQIAQANWAEADRLLTHLAEAAEAGGRWRHVIELLVLQAIALDTRGQHAEALNALSRALALAKPEGYVRLFVDEGTAIAQLLYRAAEQGIEREYAGRLLAEFPDAESTLSTKPQATDRPSDLIEPLSEREMEVLQLIAQGLSNREIAEKLVLTIGTVKVHTSNIYGKLGVNSRTQAVAKAQTLGILPPV